MKKIIAAVSLLLVALAALYVQADVPVEGREATQVTNGVNALGGIVAVNTSAGNIVSVKAMQISSATAGIAVFYSGNSAGTVLGAAYLVANTPTSIGSDILGAGMNGTSGQAIFIDQAGVLTATIRYRLER